MNKATVQVLDRIEDARWSYNLYWWYSLSSIVISTILIVGGLVSFIIGISTNYGWVGGVGYFSFCFGVFAVLGCFYTVHQNFLPARKELKAAERAHRDLLDPS